jgi:hypothetical protein
MLFNIDSNEIKSMIELSSENRQTQFPFEERGPKLVKNGQWPPTKTQLSARRTLFPVDRRDQWVQVAARDTRKPAQKVDRSTSLGQV